MSRPRIRTIKPELFDDERIVSLSVPARFVAVGLITMADDCGRLRDSAAAICGHVFPDEAVSLAKVERMLGEIVTSQFALAYEVGRHKFLWLPRFLQHQAINRPSESQLPAHPDDPYAHLPVAEAIRVARDPDWTPPAATVEQREDVETLCALMSKLSRRRCEIPESSRRLTVTDTWRRDMRLLLDTDGRDAGQVEAAIRWVDADSFWSSNVLSPAKLRLQFDRLLLAAKRSKPVDSLAAQDAAILQRAAEAIK